MLLLLILGTTLPFAFFYVVVASFLWAKSEPLQEAGWQAHRRTCGETHTSITYCIKHSKNRPWAQMQLDCDECWRVSYQQCIYKRCHRSIARQRSVRLLRSTLWLVLIPVFIGTGLARRHRRADRALLDTHIKELEASLGISVDSLGQED